MNLACSTDRSIIRYSSSSLLLFFDQLSELVEKVGGFMRPGRSFGMILHTEDRQFLVTHSFDCAVVQVDVGHFNFGGERLRIHGETVILRGDRHFASAQIFDRLIGTAMAKFQFECRSAKSEPENLMTKTNPEDWFLAHQIMHCFMRVIESRRVARAIGKKNSIG